MAADGLSVTWKLKPGLKWADGEPFTAADVVYTVESLIKYEGFNAHSYMVDNVESVTAVDENTVKFVLKQPNSRFHTTFLDRWGCTRFFPKHIFEKQADPVQFTFNLVRVKDAVTLWSDSYFRVKRQVIGSVYG